MQTKSIFIGFAAGILILVVAAASFSAGLYLGQRGYVAAMQYQSPQQGGPGQFPQGGQPPNGQFPQNGLPQSGPQAGQTGPQAGSAPQSGVAPVPGGGPFGAPSWPPDVMGRLVSLTATSITLDTPQGQVTVTVSQSTSYIDELGNSLVTADLKTGDVIAVFGRDLATTIMRLPPRPPTP